MESTPHDRTHLPGRYRIGIYPGTFDPMTFGHMAIIRTALETVDHLIIGVAGVTTKTTLFSLEERHTMSQMAVRYLQAQSSTLLSVEALPFSGLLVEFAKQVGASSIIRGLRAVSDFEYEFQMSCVNSKLCEDIPTVFLPSSDRTQFISSRFVNQIARLKGDLSAFVIPEIAQKLKQRCLEDR